MKFSFRIWRLHRRAMRNTAACADSMTRVCAECGTPTESDIPRTIFVHSCCGMSICSCVPAWEKMPGKWDEERYRK